MKKFLSFCLIASLSLFSLTACGSSSSSSASNEKRTLVVSTWGLNEDILTEDVISPFEEMYNCEVVLEIGTTAERFTKLSSNPNSNVDVIELSQASSANGHALGLFETIDNTNVPNIDYLIDSAKDALEDGCGVAYVINSLGIIYDKDALGFEITSFDDLWREELVGKIAIPDISSTFGPAMLYLASDYKNVDIEEDNGEAAFEALEELKPHIVKTYSKSSDLANLFVAGEIEVAVIGDFAISTVLSASPNLTYTVPDVTYANFNTVDINVNSENKDLAYAFINWRISNELQTKTAVSLNEAPTNSTVVLSEEDALNKTYGDVADNAKLLNYEFVNNNLSDWTDKWNRILNS